MNSPVSLKDLIVERGTPPRRRSTPWLSRYLLPGTLVIGFLLVTIWTLRESLLPAIPVTVVPVLTSTSTTVATDTPLFRAAGWIEPRPTPTFVSALAEGVVERLLVVEGQEVKTGEPVALLVKRDAQIAVEQAQADLALKHANQASALAQLNAARIYWQEPIERLAALSEAEATLAKVQTELIRIPAAIIAAQAKLEQARREVETKVQSGEAIAKIALSRAKSEVVVTSAQLEELQAQQAALRIEVAALSKRRDVLKRQLELKVEEERKLKDAEALHQAAQANVKQADSLLAAANLRLERTTVKAPITGKVLALIAKPGSRLMGIDRAALTDASTVISMYDPHRLQVRADVRLENVPKVQIGQTVRIETPAAQKPLHGRVLTTTSLTDIQKNTLQVKIELDDPPAVLKPDMLVEATFLALPAETKPDPQAQRVQLLVPEELVDASASTAFVWIADSLERRARKKTVTVGNRLADGMVKITHGLSVGDRLIAGGRESLTPGCRIQILKEAPGLTESIPSTHDQGPHKPNRLY